LSSSETPKGRESPSRPAPEGEAVEGRGTEGEPGITMFRLTVLLYPKLVLSPWGVGKVNGIDFDFSPFALEALPDEPARRRRAGTRGGASSCPVLEKTSLEREVLGGGFNPSNFEEVSILQSLSGKLRGGGGGGGGTPHFFPRDRKKGKREERERYIIP